MLRHPRVYQGFQSAGGFFGARVRSIREYLSLNSSNQVIDVGCGPGFIVEHLPSGIKYHGFDIEERYIDYAKQRFGTKGSFHCQQFDEECAAEFGPADVVMMNGLLHHLDDAAALATLRVSRRALKPEGILFTLDGCFWDGQSRIASWLLRNDRGQFVRNEDGYRRLLGAAFDKVRTHIREDLSFVPYSFLIGIAGTGEVRYADA
jgi:SAM-dependent methyltransferase